MVAEPDAVAKLIAPRKEITAPRSEPATILPFSRPTPPVVEGLFSGASGQQIDMRDKWQRLVDELMANLPEKEKPTIDAPFCGKHDDKGRVLERTHRDYHSRGALPRASWVTGIAP